MVEKVNTWMDKLKSPAFIIMILGVWYTISVTYSNVGTIDQRLEKKITIINEMHDEMDQMKLDYVNKIHSLELRIVQLETKIEK